MTNPFRRRDSQESGDTNPRRDRDDRHRRLSPTTVRVSSRPIAKPVTLIAIALGSIALSACGGMQAAGGQDGIAGTLARLKPLAKKCHGPLNGFVDLDLSASDRAHALSDERLQAIADTTDRVAACTGHIKVIAFSANISNTATLGEVDFPPSSGTETSRLIKADKTVTKFVADVKQRLPAALRAVSASGTDTIGQLDLAREYQRQRGTGKLLAVLATDGLATTGPVVINRATLRRKAAQAKAAKVTVPSLRGSEVRIFGIGRTSNASLKTTQVQSLIDFYSIACGRTGARCLVTTSYTKGG